MKYSLKKSVVYILRTLILLGFAGSLISFFSNPAIDISNVIPTGARSESEFKSYLAREIGPMLDDLVRDTISTRKGKFFNSSLADLQSRFVCFVEKGVWTRDGAGSSSSVGVVDESLKYARHLLDSSMRPIFQPGGPCLFEKSNTQSKTTNIPTQTSKHLCSALARKKILFVGPETTYHLHTTWLQTLEKNENRSHICLGAEFCTFHNICRPPRTEESGEPYYPPGGFQKYPSKRELEGTRSAVLKYILSSTLYAGEDRHDARYTDPRAQVDLGSGVRRKEMYWVGQARKANVVVMNRGPEPAPAWTYDGTRRGNWTFLRDRESLRSGLGRRVSFGPDRDSGFDGGPSLGNKIVNVALDVTANKFLYEVLKTLMMLENDSAMRGKILIWHGSWYMPLPCLQRSVKESEKYALDPWALYYNAQVYMQNYLLQALLPYYGVSFLPLAIPTPQSSEMAYAAGGGGMLSEGRKDCLRYEYGSSLEEAMRTALLSGLLTSLGGIS